MSQDKEAYYKAAIAWAEDYLAKNKEPKQIKINNSTNVTNDLLFVSVCLERIKTLPPSPVRRAEYELLRKFKVFIEELNKKVDLLNIIV